jgi:hypothetical protein
LLKRSQVLVANRHRCALGFDFSIRYSLSGNSILFERLPVREVGLPLRFASWPKRRKNNGAHRSDLIG